MSGVIDWIGDTAVVAINTDVVGMVCSKYRLCVVISNVAGSCW